MVDVTSLHFATNMQMMPQDRQLSTPLRAHWTFRDIKMREALLFECFNSKLQKNCDNLEQNGRPVDNGDIVDSLWKKIQDPNRQIFLAALKVEYMRNPRS